MTVVAPAAPPQAELLFGYQVMDEHPEWAYLAEPYSAGDLPGILSQWPVIAACDHAIACGRQAVEEHRADLEKWDDAAWVIVNTAHDRGLAEMRHRQLAEWTDRWLPAVNQAAALTAIQAAQEPSTQSTQSSPAGIDGGAAVTVQTAELPALPAVPADSAPPAAADDTAVQTAVLPAAGNDG